MNRPPWQDRAAHARRLPLEAVARQLGYRPDPRNRQRWKRPGSVLSITGCKFFDHRQGRGGGGAIDLVLHARGGSFLEALAFLAPGPDRPTAAQDGPALPAAAPACWPAVRHYLAQRRGLDPALLRRCRRQGLLWADSRRNAVFLCRDRRGRPAGAELAGTRPDPRGRTFKGLAKGSRKQAGGFWIPLPHRARPQRLLLVESAVDALSAHLLLPPDQAARTLVASSAGIAARLPNWLSKFQLPPPAILCGYDADPAGDLAARSLSRSLPGLRRLRPPRAKDWNDLLRLGPPHPTLPAPAKL